MDSIQEKALKMPLSGHNLLITEYPGTGKSLTVAHIAEQLQKQAKNVVLTAITGKAAQTLQKKIAQMSKQSCNHYSQMFRVKGWQIYQ